MDAVRLRVVSWNVGARPTGRLDAKVELLRQLEPDLALLQELSRSVYRALLPNPLAQRRMSSGARTFSWGALSTDLCRPPGSEHRLGCAVLGAASTVLLDAGVLDGSRFGVPEPAREGLARRTVVARVGIAGGRSVSAGSFQGRRAETAAARQRTDAFHAAIAGWLGGPSPSAVVGMDAHGSGNYEADPLLSPEADHGLRDVLGANTTGGADESLHLWATRDLDVQKVSYLVDEPLAAGSDRGLVLVDFAG